jgi:hypothetical protein
MVGGMICKLQMLCDIKLCGKEPRAGTNWLSEDKLAIIYGYCLSLMS